MKFDVITIFPGVIRPYLNESILKRAQKNKKINIGIHDLRAYSKDKHKKIDDRPYGGGPGMVMKIEPLIRALHAIAKNSNRKAKRLVVLFSTTGKHFNASMADQYAKKYRHMILIAGRYEGIDERFKKVVRDCGFTIQELSMGPYVLTGGEIPAMVVIDAVARHIPGVLGKFESLEETRGGIGMPVYTRPDIFIYKGKKYRVPDVLRSGNQRKIENWRNRKRKIDNIK